MKTIAVLFLDEWNDSHAENRNRDLVVASRAKKQLRNSPLAHCVVDECVCMHITFKLIKLESPDWSGFESAAKPVQQGISSLMHLEDFMERS